jgi:hypothetical protein
MQPQPPLFVSRLDPHIAPALHELKRHTAATFTPEDKRQATALLADALRGMLDTVFTQLLDDIAAHYHGDPSALPALKAAQHTIDDVKYKIDHYLGWVVKFLANKRLVPVIQHYDSMVHQVADTDLYYAGFSIPPELGQRAHRELEEMKNGTRTDAKDGIELLIEFIDVSTDPVIRTPMEVMRFNFVVTKTLNGVLHLALNHVKKMLRKLPPVLPPELLPLLAEHMENFLVFEESELEEKVRRAPLPAEVGS